MIYLTLFWEYFKIGMFTIGGGYAMLPFVTQTVEKYGWLSAEELVNFVAISESTPGPFSINLATFIGIKVGGTTSLGVFGSILGAVVSTFAVVLPSLVVIVVVTKVMDRFRSSRYVQGALYVIKPVVVGLILSALLSVACQVVLPSLNLKNLQADGFAEFNWVSLILVAAFVPLSCVKIKGKKIHPILLIILSAALGVLLFGVLEL